MNPRKLGGVLAGLLMIACGAGIRPASAPADWVPTLDLPSAERIALAADDARRLAYERDDPAPLEGHYAPALLALESHHLAGLAQRGSAVEETPRERRVVHLGAAAGRAEIVLSVGGRQRRAAPGILARPWSAFLRQWDLELVWEGGRWLVDAERDLPPDRWWK